MLDAAPRRPVALFLGVLVLLSTAAALVLPDGARGETFETVGTLGADAEAHAVTLHEGDRARFQLQPEAGEATPALRFALYDPLDRHFASFELEGMGDHVEVLADEPGDWVVVVVSQRNANLAVQLPEEQATADRVHRLEVQETTRPLVEQEDGPVDERVAFRLTERPAVAFLRAQGTVQDLDATLASDEGPVYAIRGMSVNATHQDRGEREVSLANLEEGTFTLVAQATHLNGSVDLVVQHYVRPVQDVHVAEDPNDTVNESEPPAPAPDNGSDTPEGNTTASNTTSGSDGNATGGTNATSEDENTTDDASLDGLVVARLQEEEPAWVRAGGATNVTLAVDSDTAARLLVYDGSDDLVHDVHLDAPHGHGANATGDTVTLAVPEGDGFAVYVASLRGDGDAVRVVLHDAGDTANATVLSTHATTLTLDGNRSANATLGGGLVNVHVDTRGLLEFHREVTVTGPHGVVLEYEQSVSALGLAWRDTTTTEEHFGDGAYTATTDGGSGWRGEVTVTLVSYVR